VLWRGLDQIDYLREGVDGGAQPGRNQGQPDPQVGSQSALPMIYVVIQERASAAPAYSGPGGGCGTDPFTQAGVVS